MENKRFLDLCVYTNFFLLLMQKIRVCIMTVSYTHLDVYKRQVLSSQYCIKLKNTVVLINVYKLDQKCDQCFKSNK